MWPTRALCSAGLLAYTLGAAGGLAGHFSKRTRSSTLVLLSLAGALLELAASAGALFGSEPGWTLASGVPYITYSIRLDPLSAYFTLALSLLAACVSVY